MPRYAMDEALRAQILAVPGVSALVGTRLYPDAAPPKALAPYGTLNMIGDADRAKRLNGPPMKTVRARYQVEFFAPTRAVAQQLAALVSARAADGGIDGFKGTMGTGGTAAFVQACFIENRQDGSVGPESGGEGRIYTASFDAVIVFNE